MAGRSKAEWRQELEARRTAMGGPAQTAASAALVTHLLGRPAVAEAGCLMLFWPLRGEVDLRPLARARLAVWAERRLAADLLRDEAHLAPARYGVSEVVEAVRVEVEPAAIDVCLVPGLGFDAVGYRVGYGAGLYDRWLPRLAPGCAVIGVAFAAQVVDALPHEAHDVRVSALVTELGWQEFDDARF